MIALDAVKTRKTKPQVTSGTEREGRLPVLMPSTPFAYSQVGSRTFASFHVPKSGVYAGQQRGAVVGRTTVREDWALVAVVCGAGWGGDWSGSSWSIPIASVVPVSL